MTTTGSFAKMATVEASTKRQGAVVGGLATALETIVASFKCLPLDPISPETAQQAGLPYFAEMLQTMCEGGLNILEGDILYVNSTTYKVRAVGQWHWRSSESNTLLLILEEVK